MRAPAVPVGIVISCLAACSGSSDHPPPPSDARARSVDAHPIDAHPIDARPIDAGAPSPDAANATAPTSLADTGLCLDAACTQINGDAIPYTPRLPLWIHTATKRRWIALPPGTQIDTH